MLEPPATTVFGPQSAEVSARARHVVDGVLATVEHAVEQPRVRLARCGYHATVQLNVAVSARMVRVQVAAPTFAEALDRAASGLRQRLHRLDRHLAAERSGEVGFIPDDWGSPHPQNPIGLAGTPHGRHRLVRLKDYHLAVQHPDAAAFTMDLRDYPFHLFVDDATGTDALLYRGGVSGYRLHRTVAAPVATGLAVPLTVRRWPAVPMPVLDAVTLLNAAPDRRFLFFTDPRTRRGRVIYRRYDGDFGLLAPAW